VTSPEIDVEDTELLDISADADVVKARQATRTLAAKASLSLVEQTKVVTAASELARNTLIYGGGGTVRLQLVRSDRRSGVRLEFSDDGPGIADLALALSDGYTTGTGLGLGLSGSQRLVDEFDIRSEAGAGTVVTIVKWSR
jgi:serine/threonine-protein kinase RsbT